MSDRIRTLVLAGLAALALLGGCQPTTTAEGDNASAASQPAEEQTGAGSGSGIQPMGTVPNAPVAGSDSVVGEGSGVGQAAKDQAKNAAAKVGQPRNMTGDE